MVGASINYIQELNPVMTDLEGEAELDKDRAHRVDSCMG